MLQPRETDLPLLFLVLVVLPLVAYILLGKWGEFSKKKVKISELAHIAAEEAFRAEAMAAAATIPLVPVVKLNNGLHQCTRCFRPAKTRCSRCKSVRYCSGKCQIIHWRQVHKQECQHMEFNNGCASPNSSSNEEFVNEQIFISEPLGFQFSESCNNQFQEKSFSDANVIPEPSFGFKCGERIHGKKNSVVKLTSYTAMNKSAEKMLRDQTCLERECADQVDNTFEDSRVGDVNPYNEGNGIVSKGFMKVIGLKRSSKHNKVERLEVNGDKHKKIKMLFPYEDFVKLFWNEAFNFFPTGLLNCGNSCYANAVLQCLTYTKPLTIYLLCRSHSKSCGARSWCLICELEHHVLLLRDSGEPLSLNRILLNMRVINNKMGGGSQEDAHEFLRKR